MWQSVTDDRAFFACCNKSIANSHPLLLKQGKITSTILYPCWNFIRILYSSQPFSNYIIITKSCHAMCKNLWQFESQTYHGSKINQMNFNYDDKIVKCKGPQKQFPPTVFLPEHGLPMKQNTTWLWKIIRISCPRTGFWSVNQVKMTISMSRYSQHSWCCNAIIYNLVT